MFWHLSPSYIPRHKQANRPAYKQTDLYAIPWHLIGVRVKRPLPETYYANAELHGNRDHFSMFDNAGDDGYNGDDVDDRDNGKSGDKIARSYD